MKIYPEDYFLFAVLIATTHFTPHPQLAPGGFSNTLPYEIEAFSVFSRTDAISAKQLHQVIVIKEDNRENRTNTPQHERER